MGAPHTWSLLRMLKLTDTPAVATESAAGTVTLEVQAHRACGATWSENGPEATWPS